MPKITDLPEVMRVIHDTIYQRRPKGIRSRHTQDGGVVYQLGRHMLLSVAVCSDDKNCIILECPNSRKPAFIDLSDPDLFSKVDRLASNAFAVLQWADSTEYWQ